MPRAKKETKTEKKSVAKKRTEKAGLTIPVYDLNGKEKTSLDLPNEIFSQEVNPRLLAQYVRVYLSNRRQGTASAKTRGEIIGSTRKIYRQKGTGNARHGSKKAPVFVGGGVVGGPRPRDFSLKLNRKQIKKALFNALTLKLKEQGLLGLGEDFFKMEIKTKAIADFLKALEIKEQSILFILPKIEKSNLILSLRNIGNITLADAVSLNPYEVMRNKKVFIAKESLQVLQQHFLGRKPSSQKNEN